jgi:hypothetical protein
MEVFSCLNDDSNFNKLDNEIKEQITVLLSLCNNKMYAQGACINERNRRLKSLFTLITHSKCIESFVSDEKPVGLFDE